LPKKGLYATIAKHLQSPRINNQIQARELQVIGKDNENLGVITFGEAMEKARDAGLDLIEISPGATPPVAKIMDYGKFLYEQSKKKKKQGSGHKTETKSLQIKVATGEHDLALKAKKISEWLGEGHRVKLELYLSGRMKSLGQDFLKERMDRVLNLITIDYKLAEDFRKSPKGYTIVLEKS
jgi:translation initiation factor IF-3